MQEYANGLVAREHVRHEFTGERLGGKKRYEDPGGLSRLRVGRNAHLAAFAHFLDHAENAFLGGSRHAVAQLHALLAQQFVHSLELGRAIENDRFALAAIEVVQHFPVAQVAGDAHHAFARSQGLVQHFQALDFADQVDGALRRPDPRAGAFGEGLADVHQAAAHQALALCRVHVREAFGEVDPHRIAGTVGGFPHDPADPCADGLYSAPGQQGKQPKSAYQQGAFKLFHRSLLIVCGAQSRHSNRR